MGYEFSLRTKGAVAKSAAAIAAVTFSLLGASNSAAGAEPLTLPGPASVLTLGIFPGSNDDDLKGVVCKSPNSCEAVRYPSWLSYAAGAKPLQEKLTETTGLKIVYGYSQGGQVITVWMDKYSAGPDAPSPDDLVFVIIGNGDRRHGGANVKAGHVMPETQYQVIDIARQYDFAADMPDDRTNIVAMANAIAGFRFIHLDYENVDLDDPANIVWKEGNTTYVFVPTQNLPLLEPLRRLGLNGLADKLNEPLKEIVEQAYHRDYLPAKVSQPPDSAESTDPVAPPASASAPPGAAHLSSRLKAERARPAGNDAAETAQPNKESDVTELDAVREEPADPPRAAKTTPSNVRTVPRLLSRLLGGKPSAGARAPLRVREDRSPGVGGERRPARHRTEVSPSSDDG